MIYPQEYSMCTLEKECCCCYMSARLICCKVEFEFNASFLIFCLHDILVEKSGIEVPFYYYESVFTFRYVNNLLNFRATYLRVLKFDGCERGEWKNGLKLNIWKAKIASSLITSWQMDGEIVGRSDRFYFLELQNHCGWWLQPWS